MLSANAHTNQPPINIAMLSLHSSPLGPLGTLDTGGMSVYVRETARWLGSSGHRVDIFTNAGNQSPETELYPNVRLITLGQGRFADIPKQELPEHLPWLAQALEGYRRQQGLRYDLIHSHYWISGVVGAMIQAQWQCPHLIMFHTLGAAKNRNGSGENETTLRIGHEQWLVSAADGIVVPSRGEQDNLTACYHAAPPDKINVIPCGVDLERFRLGHRLAARQRLGLHAEAQVVLFVGRFAPLKNVDKLIDAVAALRPNHSCLQLVIAGGDDPQAQSTLALQRQISRRGLGDAVRLAGRVAQDDLPDYYHAADLLALPSHYESFGLVVLEALACGTPVAATPVGAAAIFVHEGRNGVSIPTPDSQAVAQAIARFFKIPPDQRPGPAQVRASVQGCGWQTVAASLARLYRSMIRDYDPLKTVPAQMTTGVVLP